MGIFDFFKGNKKEISNDNFLLENLIFPNINGIDFINAETKSSNIKKSLEDDVDGKWYYSQSPLICLMKSVSPSIFGDELDKLLTANNLKYSNHRIRNNIKYWDFEVENNVKETENKTLIKTHLGEECPCKNPSCMSHYQFIYNTLELIEDEKKQNELYDLFLNG